MDSMRSFLTSGSRMYFPRSMTKVLRFSFRGISNRACSRVYQLHFQEKSMDVTFSELTPSSFAPALPEEASSVATPGVWVQPDYGCQPMRGLCYAVLFELAGAFLLFSFWKLV